VDAQGHTSYTTIYSNAYTETGTEENEAITPAGAILPPRNIGRRLMTLNKQIGVSVDTKAGTDVNSHYLQIALKKGGGPYSLADLVGTWYNHGLVMSQTASTATWFYGSWNVDATGVVTGGSSQTAFGTSTPAPVTFQISANGVVTTTTVGSPFHGIITQDKRMIIATTHFSQTVVGFAIYQIRNPATTFSQDDLQGTWNFHTLIAGVYGTDTLAWAYGRATVNGDAMAIRDTIANGAAQPDTDHQLAMASDGVVTLVGEPDLPFQGVMSDDKTMMISVSRNGGGDGYALAVYQK
jgi:hypothetical protein